MASLSSGAWQRNANTMTSVERFDVPSRASGIAHANEMKEGGEGAIEWRRRECSQRWKPEVCVDWAKEGLRLACEA